MSTRTAKHQPKASGPAPEFLARRRRQTTAVVLALVVLAGIIGCVKIFRTVRSPDSPFLVSSGRAKWIVEDRPAILDGQKLNNQSLWFRRSFTIVNPPARAMLIVRGLRQCSVALDGAMLLSLNEDPSAWNRPREVDLTQRLTPGEHAFVIMVNNDRGPPALQAQFEALNLFTDQLWETSVDQQQWKPARLANTPLHAELSDQFPSVRRSILKAMPVWLVVMLLTAAAVLWMRQESNFGKLAIRFVRPSNLRWILMAAWSALGINNIFRMPSYIAFDAIDHMRYIEYVAKNWRIPLANEGWQMFQSPLYYMICAPLYAVVQHWWGIDGRAMAMRVVPLLCGLGMIEILRRVMRRAFPDRTDLQSLGMVLGTLLPMHVYISQMVGNEPVAGVMSAWVILLALGMSGEIARSNRIRYFVAIGLVLGLALLSKATAILLIPVVTIWLAAWLWSQGATTARLIRGLAFFGVSAALIAGWYYARNYSEFKGKFVVGGWDPDREMLWWQDPGYRTIGEFFRFGHAIVQPIHAAFNGFWDGLYSTLWTEGYLSGQTVFTGRPPWNEHALIAGSLLGLIPTALIVMGLLAWLRRPLVSGGGGASGATSGGGGGGGGALTLSIACLFVYLGALLQLYVQLPIYSTVKASYLLGIAPCLAIIAMSGARLVMRNRWSKAVVMALLIGWAVNVYCTYFVVQTIAPATPAVPLATAGE